MQQAWDGARESAFPTCQVPLICYSGDRLLRGKAVGGYQGKVTKPWFPLKELTVQRDQPISDEQAQ